MRWFGVFCCLLVITALPAQSGADRNYRQWWNELSQDEQLVAVDGAMTGYFAGYTEGIAKAASSGSSITSAMKHFPRFKHIMGYYAAAITDFYVNHPDGAYASTGDVLGCLADEPITSCDELAKHSHP